MAAPKPPDQSLQAARNETLVETNAQAIFENLRKLGAFHAVHRRRWIWELLQNAADAADSTTGKNRVRIDADGNKMRFRHCGSAFSAREISHLIYHGSSKQGDENKRGKFGSGFLTIHLVSHKVRILGVLENDGTRQAFEFFLDRSGDAPQAIQEKMEVAWDCFTKSLGSTNGEGAGEFTTVFECDLDLDAGEVVESGLADLARTVPYVLAFVDELEEVTVGTTDGTRSWRRGERLYSQDLTTTEIICNGTDGHSEIVRVAVVGDHVQGVALAVLLRPTGQHWEVVVDNSTPRLFYPLPLVDTHSLPIPFAIASDSFEPREERNGILAGSADGSDKPTEKNWALLREVPLLFKTLVEACVRELWLERHKLATFGEAPTNHEWLDAKKLVTEVLLKTINFLRSKDAPELVWAADGKFLSIADAAIPIQNLKGTTYKLAGEVIGVKDRLPMPQVAPDWAATLEGWAAVLGSSVELLGEALTVDKLANHVAHCKTLEELGASLTSGTGAGALAWLNRLLDAVPTENLLAFVQSRAVLPNQKGQLKKVGELLLDSGIEEDIKNVCEKLGDSVRTGLLHTGICQPVRQLFEGMTGRLLSNEHTVERALKKIKEPSAEGKEEAYAEANTQFVGWLIEHDQKQKLAGYPMLCASGRSELRADRPLLAPVTLWENGAQYFADLFPEDRRLEENYAASLGDNHWRYLIENGFVLRSLFVMEPLDMLDQRQVVEILSDDTEHKPTAVATISQIAFLSGILGEVRRSKPKARRFLQFLLRYVIKGNQQWVQGVEVACLCKLQHHVFPGWMFQVKTHEWVPVGRGKEDKPSAENIAALLDDELKQTILGDQDCAEFLLRMGIGVSELLRYNVPPEKRSQLDRLSARIYASADESVVESIEAVLDNPDIKEAVLNKIQEKEKVARNQKVGRMVEDLLRKELEGAGIQVKRTGVGSDFELESDFVEDQEEQLLKVNRYLLEVKSTSVSFVRMTLRQGEEAIKPDNRDNYLLCVVDVSSGIVNEQVVRDNAKFVFGIGPMVEDKVNDAKGLKNLEGELSPGSGGAVEIDIVQSSVKLRISDQVWLEQGASFLDFVEQVKQQA